MGRIRKQTTAISIRSFTMSLRRMAARQPQITDCRLILGQRQPHHQTVLIQPKCGHLVLQLRKWLKWIDWSNSSERSMNARKLPLLALTKRWAPLETWVAWDSWLSNRWTWIAKPTSRVMNSIRSKSTRVRANMTYSYKHRKHTWTRLTRKVATCGRLNSSNNEKNS